VTVLNKTSGGRTKVVIPHSYCVLKSPRHLYKSSLTCTIDIFVCLTVPRSTQTIGKLIILLLLVTNHNTSKLNYYDSIKYTRLWVFVIL